MSTGYDVQIGYIRVTNGTVYTQYGQFPLKGSRWSIDHYWETRRQLPTWAIVAMCVTVFFCLVGLLFLLVKEDVTTEYARVVFASGDGEYATLVPIMGQAQYDYLESLVSYVEMLEAHYS